MTGPDLLLSLILVVLATILGLIVALNWAKIGPKTPDRDAVIAARVRRRVLVTLKSGTDFVGILAAADDQAWVLVDASAVRMGDNGADLPVDGEIILMTAEIAYVQKP